MSIAVIVSHLGDPDPAVALNLAQTLMERISHAVYVVTRDEASVVLEHTSKARILGTGKANGPLNHSNFRNLGANRAEADGARTLVFLDSTVGIRQGFAAAAFRPHDEALVGTVSKPWLYGFLSLTLQTYRRVGGFDDRVDGSIASALDFRVRALRKSVGFRELPATFFSDEGEVDHDPELDDAQTFVLARHRIELPFVAKTLVRLLGIVDQRPTTSST